MKSTNDFQEVLVRKVNQDVLRDFVQRRIIAGKVIDQTKLAVSMGVSKHAISRNVRELGILPTSGSLYHERSVDKEDKTHEQIANEIIQLIETELKDDPFTDDDLITILKLNCSVNMVRFIRKKFGIKSCHHRKWAYSLDGQDDGGRLSDWIKRTALNLVKSEDRSRPLSDAEIVKKLKLSCHKQVIRDLREKNGIPCKRERAKLYGTFLAEEEIAQLVRDAISVESKDRPLTDASLLWFLCLPISLAKLGKIREKFNIPNWYQRRAV